MAHDNKTGEWLDPLFEVHMLNEEGKVNAVLIAREFNKLLTYLSTVCPSGREYSIVKTKLEEACFYAKKSMAGSFSAK